MLESLTDQQLMNRFSIAATGFEMPAEASEIKQELERRGYLYDARYRDFLTCQEWNKRHGDWSPQDCS